MEGEVIHQKESLDKIIVSGRRETVLEDIIGAVLVLEDIIGAALSPKGDRSEKNCFREVQVLENAFFLITVKWFELSEN